jgi:hypothetical protein
MELLLLFKKMIITRHLNFSYTNQDQVRNQQPQLYRILRIHYLGRNAGILDRYESGDKNGEESKRTRNQ